MDFGLSKKHEMARSLFKEFAENEVKPLAQEVDETEKFPRATVDKMAKYGFLGIPVPKELGGQGCDILTYAMCVEELSKVCGTTGVIVSAHTSLCVDPILTFGTPEQKEKYVPYHFCRSDTQFFPDKLIPQVFHRGTTLAGILLKVIAPLL